MSFLVSEIACI